MGCGATGHLPYTAGVWLGLESRIWAAGERSGAFQLKKRRREGGLRVRHSEFRILPFFPVCLITLDEWFDSLRLRCFSCRRRIKSISQEHLEEGMGCI